VTVILAPPPPLFFLTLLCALLFLPSVADPVGSADFFMGSRRQGPDLVPDPIPLPHTVICNTYRYY
jgi:hypothetical protein